MRARLCLYSAVTGFGVLACTSSPGAPMGTSSAGMSAADVAGAAGSPASVMGGASAGGASAGGTSDGAANGGSSSISGGTGGAAGSAGAAGTAAEVVVHPLATDEAFANPLAGFRPDLGNTNHYATLFSQYIKWNEIEKSESDGVDKIKAFTDAAWKSLPALNAKVIPRVYLDYPGQGTYWPSDLTTNDYTSDAFKARLKRLIGRLGQVWDGDPRVAFVQTGLIGQWGEQHDPAPDASLAPVMSDASCAMFVASSVRPHVSMAFAISSCTWLNHVESSCVGATVGTTPSRKPALPVPLTFAPAVAVSIRFIVIPLCLGMRRPEGRCL